MFPELWFFSGKKIHNPQRSRFPLKPANFGLSLFCIGLLSGCGGAGDELSVVAPTSSATLENDRSSKTSDKQAVINPLAKPVAAGTERVVHFSYNAMDPIYEKAEDILAQFDEIKIPFDIVACNGFSPTGGSIAAGTNFLIVIDVQQENLAAAQKMGFFRLTPEVLKQIGSVNSAVCSDPEPYPTAHQRIQGYARRVYKHLFISEFDPEYKSPLGGVYMQYQYRYYWKTGNYLGVAGDDVYVHNGRDWNLLHVGKIKDFIPYIDGIPGTRFEAKPGQ